MQEMYKELAEIAGGHQVRMEEPLKKHVTFRTGGNADFFVTADSPETLAALVRYLKKVNQNYYILGNGSNLLFPDEGYRGVIIKVGRFSDDLVVEGTRIRAGAGVLLSQVANAAYQASLTGLEFAAGIPGTLGGAVVMNAGAYGGEMKDVIVSVTAIDENGEFVKLSNEELELSYRHSVIPERNLIVTDVTMELVRGDTNAIKSQMDELAAKRREKQPLEYPSAGSTFKRPEGYFAGKLIEDAGLRGFQVGGAQVSEKHCGFVVNKGEATTADILELVRQVQNRVSEKFGVRLEMEVKVVK